VFLRLLALVSLLLLSQASLAQQLRTTALDDVPETCPVTRSPALPFVPPWPYPLKAGPGAFWFGTDSLWTALPADGAWRDLPHYRQKLFFGRKGYVVRTEQQPKLTVTGRRLDSPAPPLLADKAANNGWVKRDQPFIVTGINFPTLGCWEIIGRNRDAELTFVVWVAK
jgi:hypothetical protein